MLGHVGDLVKDVCEAIGRRLTEYRTECTRKHGLDASKLKRGPVACGVGCIAAPDLHQRAVQTHHGRCHGLERTGIIEHERRERMIAPLHSRHHEFSKSLSALGMPVMVNSTAWSIDVESSSEIGNVEFFSSAIE